MKIKILDTTTEFPLQLVGERAGICWNSDIDSDKKNINRAKTCILSNHNRTLEFVNVEFVIEGASARVIRELYTHIGGSPTRLQESTRYVETNNLEYYTPPKIKSDTAAEELYVKTMEYISSSYNTLIKLGVPKEDVANILPLGMHTKIVMKMNLRTLINLFNVRLCNKSYVEIRELVKLLKKELEIKNDEWMYLSETLFVPKCEVNNYINPKMNYCTESVSCGRHPLLKDKFN